MHRITFNQNTSAYAASDRTENLMFIKHWVHFLNEVFKTRGYIYVNRIYESFGVKWDPRWENQCYIYEGQPIDFEVCDVDDGFVITIN